jgi:hypothetical protein
MKSDRLIRIVSMALGLLSLAALVYVDNEIAATYRQSDGKTQAMFGIIEITRFSYKYLILIPAILSIVLTAVVLWKGKFSLLDIGSLVIGVIAILGIVTSSWRLII